MNRIRRWQLQSIIDRLEDVKSELETLKDEEAAYRDSIPETLHYSEQFKKSDEACDNLENAFDGLVDILSYLDAIG